MEHRPAAPEGSLLLAIHCFLTRQQQQQQQQQLQQSGQQPDSPRSSSQAAPRSHALALASLTAMDDDPWRLPPQVRPLLKQAKDTGTATLKRLAPFTLQLAASAAAYTAGLGLCQVTGLGLRVSCNSRLLGPCLGCLGVGTASAFAGHTSRHVRRCMESGRPLVDTLASIPLAEWQMEEAMLDALVGVAAFKVLGGSFRRLMPSDLRYPGAFARGSLPAGRARGGDSTEYLSDGPGRRYLQGLLLKDGCHSCGKRGGGLVGDHMPPNKLYREAVEAASKRPKRMLVFLNKVVTRLPGGVRDRARDLVARVTSSGLPTQHFYPHCTACSNKQGAALSGFNTSKPPPLVLHRLSVPPGPLPGVLAGLRFLATLPDGPGRSSRPPTKPAKGRGAGKRAQAKAPAPWLSFPWATGCSTPKPQLLCTVSSSTGSSASSSRGGDSGEWGSGEEGGAVRDSGEEGGAVRGCDLWTACCPVMVAAAGEGSDVVLGADDVAWPDASGCDSPAAQLVHQEAPRPRFELSTRLEGLLEGLLRSSMGMDLQQLQQQEQEWRRQYQQLLQGPSGSSGPSQGTQPMGREPLRQQLQWQHQQLLQQWKCHH